MRELDLCQPLQQGALFPAAITAAPGKFVQETGPRPGSMAARLRELEAWDEQENYQENYGPQCLGAWGTDAETLECALLEAILASCRGC